MLYCKTLVVLMMETGGLSELQTFTDFWVFGRIIC